MCCYLCVPPAHSTVNDSDNLHRHESLQYAFSGAALSLKQRNIWYQCIAETCTRQVSNDDEEDSVRKQCVSRKSTVSRNGDGRRGTRERAKTTPGQSTCTWFRATHSTAAAAAAAADAVVSSHAYSYTELCSRSPLFSALFRGRRSQDGPAGKRLLPAPVQAPSGGRAGGNARAVCGVRGAAGQRPHRAGLRGVRH